MPGVFICYRREDSSPYAGRIYDRLAEVFGTEQVFMDVDAIRPGDDFVEAIEASVRSCDAMLVVIGRDWLKRHVENGLPRLHDSHDYVRIEIASALERRIRIIPVLVSGAKMPAAGELPDDIAALSRRQAVELMDTYFRQGLMALADTLQTLITDRSGSLADEDDQRVVKGPTNLGFDGRLQGAFPHGWFDSVGFVDGASAKYIVRVVQRVDAPGQCLLMQKHSAHPQEFGSVMQRFRAGFLAGHTIRLEGDLKTQAVEQWAGLWLRADGSDTANLFFDNMQGRGIRGTLDWRRYMIEGYLPPETAWLNLGVVLSGSGTVWADNLRLLVSRNDHWEDV